MPGGGYVTGKQRSVSASRFAMVPRNDVPRSAFDVSHGHKTTFDAGYLIPVYVDEVLPGDSLRLKMTAFARLATPIVPVMDNIILESFFFFVPNRLLWANWERFMGEQLTPSDTTAFLLPRATFAGTDLLVGTPGDYMGITLNSVVSANTISVNALPFRAYELIWSEWFRDQDLQAPIPAVPNVSDGPDSGAAYAILRRGKRHDYFTTARPWPAKPTAAAAFSNMAAFPADYVPGRNMTAGPRGILGYAGAPITGLGVLSGAASTAGSAPVIQTGSRTEGFGAAGLGTGHWSTADDAFYMMANNAGTAPDVRVLVNDIRTAIMVQGLMEKNARGGTRYSELVRSHFGVLSPDQRLQRPEYLGGGRATINVNPVAQTFEETGGDRVLGELAGIGTVIANNHGFSASFTEHGVLLGLVSVRADMTYQNGINRMWFRSTQYDFYWPGLAHLGEQAIFSKEIYADGVAANDDTVFGYQERWSEYKYKPSRVSGAFRSTMTTPLDMWHLAQNFSPRPVLNAAFIVENPPMERVLQVDTTFGEQFLFDSIFDCRWVRPMPMYSLPGLGPRL